ncbi:GNAT family N-acetyltransferase [Paenibacillus sp. 1001270B_150601_E10]|uniref:GNAT family N-acetyltransferase n=1 Tax=Paenibacillus sp. 1001270B_150601_E10 TaxID=2787079 RepID=UPI00189F6E72|nr:GNAT family N-acetyltransferase [Paenibacillus sp. 1001270B_150601_E10]
MGLIIIERAKQHDFANLLQMWGKAVRSTHHFLNEEDISFYREVVRNEALPHLEVWMIVGEDKQPLGFIGLDKHRIEMLFVDPNFHGQGLGTKLIQFAQERYGNQLLVDVNEQNNGACRFYERYGFVQVGRSELDGSGRPFPILHLELQSYKPGVLP